MDHQQGTRRGIRQQHVLPRHRHHRLQAVQHAGRTGLTCTIPFRATRCPRSNNHDQVHRPGTCCVQIALLPLRSGSEPRAHYLSLFLIAYVPLLVTSSWGFSSISLFRATHDTHAADCASCVARHVLCDAARIVPRMHMLWSSAVDLSLRHHVVKLPQSCPAPGAHSNPAV